MRSQEERILITHEDRLDKLEFGQLRLSQQMPGLWQRGAPQGGGGGTRVGFAYGSISARSGTTLGSGYVEIYTPAGGGLTSTGVTIPVYSLDDEEIDSGLLCSVTTIDGVDVAIRLECGT